jgi:uncharacterized protein YodC (DUF2158 family)
MTDTICGGDIVQLNSGGPQMTVLSIGEDGKAVCLWTDDESAERSDKFPLEALNFVRRYTLHIPADKEA